MASSYFPAQPYTPPVAPNGLPAGYQSTTNPRALAQNQRQLLTQQGQQYQTQDQQLADQYLANASGTQAYLNPIESNLATGGGGYSPSEQAQIELTPQQQQNIVTSAGITAGANTAAGVGAAERAAAAAGGNPAALATYRARAAQQEGNQAADAMTQGAVAAQQAGSQGAQAVGSARMAQQGQGLNYFGGLQGQQTQTGLAEQGLGQQAYGTEAGATNTASDIGLQASQTPSTLDKVTAGLASAASALADGKPGGAREYMADGRMEAVAGEDGPEIIVEGARHMAAGGEIPQIPMQPTANTQTMGTQPGPTMASPPPPMQPTANTQTMGTAPPPRTFRSVAGNIVRNYLKQPQQQNATPPVGQQQRPWSPVDTATSAGKLIGTGIKAVAQYLAEGSGGPVPRPEPMMPPKLITQPTRVKLAPGDKVIPLSFRAKAKIRPSAALPAIQAMQRVRPMAGAPR